MAVIQVGGSDWNGNSGAGRVVLFDDNGVVLTRETGDSRSATDSMVPIGGVNDDSYRHARMDRLGNLGIASTNVLFHEPFEGATVSVPSRIAVSTTTFAQAQTSSAGLNFNNTNLTTAAAAALITSNRRFLKMQRAPLQCKARARMSHFNNAVMEIGFGLPASQTVSPTVGAFWQVTTGGVVQGVLTFNAVDITSAVTMPSNWQDNYYVWDVILDDDEVMYTVQDTGTGLIVAETKIKLPVTQSRLWDASHLPVYARLHNVTAPATAASLLLTSLDVVMTDTTTAKPWPHVMAMNGFGGEVSPTLMTQTANYTNSAAPASATLSNTAAGYTTLGGQFQFAAPVGAETDFALFGYTVPAPYSFVCTGIDITTFNMGAAVATTAHVLQWFASPDQTAISLATATNRRVSLGSQTLAVATPIGGGADREINRIFDQSPLVTHPTRIMVVGVKLPVGTATASQIIRGVVAIRGYFE